MLITQNNDLHVIKIQSYLNNLDNFSNSSGAIFLDRDGVLIEDKHYLSSPSLVELEKGVENLINISNSLELKLFVITNQSGVGRGYFSWEDYQDVTNMMLKLLPSTNSICAIYASGESPEKSSRFRKPSPYMIKLACSEYNIDPKKSIFIGDRISDLQAAARSEIQIAIHTLTGKGKAERNLILESTKKGFFVDSFSNSKIKIKFINCLEELCLDNFLIQ